MYTICCFVNPSTLSAIGKTTSSHALLDTDSKMTELKEYDHGDEYCSTHVSISRFLQVCEGYVTGLVQLRKSKIQ
jgi:hypothetical protein